MSEFKKGDSVVFKPGPKSTGTVTATIEDFDGSFLVTKDSAGKVRKVRKGAATPA